MAAWCAARTQSEVVDAFTAADAAIGPVLDMAEIASDPHYAQRGTIETAPDGFEGTPMQSVTARVSATPGSVPYIHLTLPLNRLQSFDCVT